MRGTESAVRSAGDAAAAVDAMQDAALERAVVDGIDATAHLAFAGALEGARPVPTGADPLLLGSLLAVAIETRYGAGVRIDGLRGSESLPSGTPSTPVEPDGQRRPAVEGALLAYDRFDLSTETAAALADTSVADFEAERRGR